MCPDYHRWVEAATKRHGRIVLQTSSRLYLHSLLACAISGQFLQPEILFKLVIVTLSGVLKELFRSQQVTVALKHPTASVEIP